jgi:flagellar motor component MotA
MDHIRTLIFGYFTCLYHFSLLIIGLITAGEIMIKQFVDRFMANKDKLESIFITKHPENYEEIVKSVVRIISDEDECNDPDPERIL